MATQEPKRIELLLPVRTVLILATAVGIAMAYLGSEVNLGQLARVSS